MLFALCAMLAVSSSAQVTSGVAFGIDNSVITETIQFITPFIQRILPKVVIPEIEQDGFTVSNVKVNSDTIDKNGVIVQFQQLDNSVQVDLNDVAIDITGDFKYKWFFISFSGNFEAKVEQGGAQIQMGLPLSTQICPDSGRQVLDIQVNPFNLYMDKSKIDISIGGGVVADIAEAFVWLFQSVIINSITKEINEKVPAALETDLNAALANSNGVVSIGGMSLDIALPEAPVITSSEQLDVYLNATFFNVSFGEILPDTNLPSISMNMNTTESVQLDVSDYSIDSLLLVLHEEGKIAFELTNDTIPELTTTMLEPLLPGLIERYGDGQGMAIKISSAEAPFASLTPDTLDFDLNLFLDFWVVGNESAVVLDAHDVDTKIKLTFTNFTLYPKVDSISFGKFTYSDSKIGDLDMFAIKEFLNIGIKFVLPVLNKHLASGFQLPDEILHFIKIESADFEILQDYMAITFSPVFKRII